MMNFVPYGNILEFIQGHMWSNWPAYGSIITEPVFWGRDSDLFPVSIVVEFWMIKWILTSCRLLEIVVVV